MADSNSRVQLDTDTIFIDTEVFVREKFDWNSSSFSRLKELVKENHLRVLTTSITKMEVMRKHREALDNAAKSVRKHEVILGQLGASIAAGALNAPNAASELESQLVAFLKDINVREVPLCADLDSLFKDYFSQSPPFSEGKKSEFPDAVVLSSLRHWCSELRKKIYIVSGDPDLKLACGEAGDLLHVERIGDIISMATVTKQVHGDLLKFVAESEYLASTLSEELRGSAVKVTRLYGLDDIEGASGVVSGATDVRVTHLNVISKDQNVFECEIEIEVCLSIDFTIDFGGRYAYEDYVSPQTVYENDYVYLYFYPIVAVRFDTANPDQISIVSVDFSPDVEVEAREVDVIRSAHRRRL